LHKYLFIDLTAKLLLTSCNCLFLYRTATKASIQMDLEEKLAKGKKTLDSFLVKKAVKKEPITAPTGIRVHYDEIPDGVDFTRYPYLLPISVCIY
jgi:hypothetical protein